MDMDDISKDLLNYMEFSPSVIEVAHKLFDCFGFNEKDRRAAYMITNSILKEFPQVNPETKLLEVEETTFTYSRHEEINSIPRVIIKDYGLKKGIKQYFKRLFFTFLNWERKVKNTIKEYRSQNNLNFEEKTLQLKHTVQIPNAGVFYYNYIPEKDTMVICLENGRSVKIPRML